MARHHAGRRDTPCRSKPFDGGDQFEDVLDRRLRQHAVVEVDSNFEFDRKVGEPAGK
jgi:hypothetical protein